jgi:hypothetical protein
MAAEFKDVLSDSEKNDGFDDILGESISSMKSSYK